MSLQACMGGWCTKRAKCPHYHAEDRREPEERLCWPDQDGEVLDVVRFVPVRLAETFNEPKEMPKC